MRLYCVNILLFLLISGQGRGQSKLFDHFTHKDGMPSGSVYASIQGADGNMWFACTSSLCSFNGISFTVYPLEKIAGDEVCIGMTMDRSNNLLCFTSNGNIYKQQGNKFIRLPLQSSILEEHIINSIYSDRTGGLFISTVIPGGLYYYNKELTLSEISDINACSFYIKKIKQDGFVWGSNHAADVNNKLRVLTSENPYTITLSEKSEYSKSYFLVLEDGTYLFAKDFELIILDDHQLISRVFVENNVQSVLQDKEGKLWIGLYQSGVISYSNSDINSNVFHKYLGGKTVSSISEDNAGNIWFATLGDGIYFLPSRTVLAYKPPQIYSSVNNKNVEEIQHAVVSNTRPEISAITDFRVINTDTTRYDTIPPNIYISGIRILGRDTVEQSSYSLPYNMNYITISYVGFAYSNPNVLQYKYTMEGLNTEVVYTNQSTVQYTTLPPGKYRFKVSAMNKKGYWSESPAVIEFEVMPPFWNTWWFRITATTFGIMAIILIMYLWIKSVRRKEQLKTNIKKQMADLELQALKAQMNPHFIFNTMSSIQHLIVTGEKEDALKYLSRLAKLMRMIMENSSKTRVTVHDELVALEYYLQLESLRFKDKFSYSIIIDEMVDTQYDSIPAMLLQPYVENSILHGFSEKTIKGHLTIAIGKNEEGLCCSIEDNGIGRERAEKKKRSSRMHEKSRAMSITASR